MKNILLTLEADRMSGVMSALIPGDHIEVSGDEVDNFAFALIPPLSSYDDYICHDSSREKPGPPPTKAGAACPDQVGKCRASNRESAQAGAATPKATGLGVGRLLELSLDEPGDVIPRGGAHYLVFDLTILE